jgi:anthranilate phosphoribosyltransferase
MQPKDLREILANCHIAFAYQPNILPESVLLAQYRAEIGKRPPFATLELLWSPYAGDVRLVSGFVHPPTEDNLRGAIALRGQTNFITIKGLEGSMDLPQSRTAIVGIQNQGAEFSRLTLSCRDYGISAEDLPILPAVELAQQIKALVYPISGGIDVEPLRQAVLWNSGFLLWQGGITDNLQSGITHTQTLLESGAVGDVLTQLQRLLA